MEEIWKDIEDFEEFYIINNIWIVKRLNYNRSWREKILKLRIDKAGYLYTTLSKNSIRKTCKVHRLVAKTFIPNPYNKPQVNHINWIKSDNRVENLEWVTGAENILHAYKIWLKKPSKNHFYFHNNPNKWVFGKESRNAKPILQYTKELILIREWWSSIDATRELLIDSSSISRCCKWKSKTAWWFIWRYN